MTCAEETTYRGTSMTKIVDPKNEIRKRISATTAVLKKLDIFFGSEPNATKNESC